MIKIKISKGGDGCHVLRVEGKSSFKHTKGQINSRDMHK